MFTSYRRRFFTWLTLTLSLAWKSVAATREVSVKGKSFGCFCFLLYHLLGVKYGPPPEGDFLGLWATPP